MKIKQSKLIAFHIMPHQKTEQNYSVLQAERENSGILNFSNREKEENQT